MAGGLSSGGKPKRKNAGRSFGAKPKPKPKPASTFGSAPGAKKGRNRKSSSGAAKRKKSGTLKKWGM